MHKRELQVDWWEMDSAAKWLVKDGTREGNDNKDGDQSKKQKGRTAARCFSNADAKEEAKTFLETALQFNSSHKHHLEILEINFREDAEGADQCRLVRDLANAPHPTLPMVLHKEQSEEVEFLENLSNEKRERDTRLLDQRVRHFDERVVEIMFERYVDTLLMLVALTSLTC